jgi:DNA-binding transcriptional LysR family regulator
MLTNPRLTSFDWTLVRSFLGVLDEGSLQGAGRKLGLSQPTVSRHMADLEAQLGLALFERTGRGLVPTEVGLNLAESARVMEEGAHRLAQVVSGAQDNGTGTVRITASQPVACILLPPILKRLRQEMPTIQIELVSSDAVNNLLRREADIAVRMVQPDQASVISRRIGKINLGAYAHVDYLRRRAAPRTLAELLKHELIGNDRSEVMIQGFAKFGVPMTREHFAFRTDDLIASWQAVRAGLGIGFIASYLARTDAHLVPVLPQLAIPPIPVWLAVHREIRTNKKIRAVYGFLAEHLPPALEPGER